MIRGFGSALYIFEKRIDAPAEKNPQCSATGNLSTNITMFEKKKELARGPV